MTRTNFRMEDFKNISMIRGDTVSFGIEIADGDGKPIDINSAFFTVKKNYSDVSNIFQKKLNNGITKQKSGEYVVRIAPEDTASEELGQYFYDFQIGVGSDIYTMLRGIFEIEWEVS